MASPRKGSFGSPAEASSVQTSQAAGPFVLGGSVGTASSYIPAFDFVPDGSGLATVSDGHRDIRKEMKCPTRSMKDLTKCL